MQASLFHAPSEVVDRCGPLVEKIVHGLPMLTESEYTSRCVEHVPTCSSSNESGSFTKGWYCSPTLQSFSMKETTQTQRAHLLLCASLSATHERRLSKALRIKYGTR